MSVKLETSLNDVPACLIIFDGVCNFCNASTQFIIQRDPSARFSFTTVQSTTGGQLLADLNIDPNDPTTFVLIKEGVVFLKSNAALEICKDLTGAWPMASYLRFVPLLIRDWIYQLIAKNRYKLMGKRQSCMIPTPDIKARFID